MEDDKAPVPAVGENAATAPKPIRRKRRWIAAHAGAVIVTAGGLFVVTCIVQTPMLGARRSTQLRWEQRRQEAIAAIAAEAAPEGRSSQVDAQREP